jgi:hypothetical protein
MRGADNRDEITRNSWYFQHHVRSAWRVSEENARQGSTLRAESFRTAQWGIETKTASALARLGAHFSPQKEDGGSDDPGYTPRRSTSGSRTSSRRANRRSRRGSSEGLAGTQALYGIAPGLPRRGPGPEAMTT